VAVAVAVTAVGGGCGAEEDAKPVILRTRSILLFCSAFHF
jgi:hypothetical protein